jgi:antirestriction protein ArdC
MYKKSLTKVNYQEITNQLIKIMEDGVIPMGSRWTNERNKRMPFNIATGKSYRGMNIIHLWVNEMVNNYTSNGWMTINQMRTINMEEEGKPIKLIHLPHNTPGRADNKTGQTGVPVFHSGTFIPREWEMQNTGDNPVYRSNQSGDYANKNEVTYTYLKIAGHVFNLDQIENLPEKYAKFDELLPFEDMQPEIAHMTTSYGCPINRPDTRHYSIVFQNLRVWKPRNTAWRN